MWELETHNNYNTPQGLCQCMKGCFWAAHVLFKNSLWKVMDCGRISTSYAYWSQNVWAAEHLSSETVVKLRILRRLFDHVLKRLSWVGPYNLLPLINLIRSYVFWYPMFLLYTVTCKVVKYLTKTPLTWRTTSLCLFGFESKPLGHKNPRTDFSCTSNACISKKQYLQLIHVVFCAFVCGFSLYELIIYPSWEKRNIISSSKVPKGKGLC